VCRRLFAAGKCCSQDLYAAKKNPEGVLYRSAKKEDKKKGGCADVGVGVSRTGVRVASYESREKT